MVPAELRAFFWDIDIESFDPLSHPAYTIERLLELGTAEAVEWLETQFSKDQIRDVLRRDTRLSPKSATFWALVYEVPAHDVAALR